VFLESVERILALGAEVLLPGHHGPVVGTEVVQVEIERVRDATRYVHDETVAGMNAGKSLWQLMDEIVLPPELAVGEGYGKVSWDVRAVWELYAGWFKHESTTELYGRPRSSVDAEIVALAGADALVARARAVLADDPVAAIHLAEIATGDDPGRDDARAVLAQAHRLLRAEASNFWLASWLDHQIERHAGVEGPA
jgi:alkyl sulfatase BDS1-like metallo-beta-lactamase superfamily hydrolase